MTESDALDKLRDPRFFIERFFWLVDKQRNEVPFKFNPPQVRYFKARTPFDLILKARKEGFSTLIEALWLHACMFNKNVRAVTLSHEMESTKRHFDRVKYFLGTMGFKEQKFAVELDENNQKQISFPFTNSSYWIGTAGAKAFGRGDDITHLHFSEVAHYENQDVLTSALEACVPGAMRVMETTANGVGEAFYSLWKEARQPESESQWKPHFFAWYEDPTNVVDVPAGVPIRLNTVELQMQKTYNLTLEQVLWYRRKRSELPEKEKMPQEHPSNAQEAFLSAGRHVFDLAKLAEKEQRLVKPLYVGDLEDDGQKVKLHAHSEGRLRLWKQPRRGASYLIAADVAEGVPDGDWSVAPVLDRNTWEQVGVWRGRVNPGEFGEILVTLARYFNDAVLVPELNNNGWATVERIKALSYPHLLNTKTLWKNDETPRDGFPTNERTKQLAITALRNANDDDTIYINDPVTISEMSTYIQNANTGKLEAQDKCHDDCVMALAIGAYCLGFMTVDATYREDAPQHHGSPLRTTSMVNQPTAGGYRRHSATGYR
jgi:hypothetical protein